MEIFCRNLDPDSNDRAFTRQLGPIMKDLSISHYHCDKPRKKPFGFVTFLSREQGELFLKQHGESPLDTNQHGQGVTSTFGRRSHRQNRPPTKSRLTILGREIFCKKSNRDIDPLTLHALENSSDGKDAPKDNKGTTEPMSFTDLAECACGYYAFRDGKLTFISEWNTRTKGSAKFTKKLLIIRLDLESEIQIRIPLQSIVELNASDDGNMTLSLTTIPTFLKGPSVIEMMASLISRSRSTLARVSAVDEQHQKAVAFCLVYRIQFQNHDMSPYRRHIRQLKKQNVLSIVHNLIPMADAPGSGFLSYDDKIAKLNTSLALWGESGRLPFAILFQLQALAYNGYFPPDILEQVAYRLVQEYTEASDTGEKPPSAEAIQKLFRWIDYRTTEMRAEELEVDYIMSLLREAQEEVVQSAEMKAGQGQSVLSNATQIFRATVMPSRIILHGPELEAQNRVLRKFPAHQDYFLRVQFCDDDGRDLFFNSRISLEPIYKRFISVLDDGILIAGRIYNFLGFSHSSLRAHSAWFTAPFLCHDTVFCNRNIIEDLGNFSKIRCPARKAARIGQAFSETPFFVPLDAHDISVTYISDVWNGDRIFSDGVGSISTDALAAAWKHLAASSNLPTCLQIRFAGAKGMLALDPRLSGKQIAIRQSMIKFESDDIRNLEVCDTASRPINLVLNRQMIKILEDMGVPYEWFLDLQNQEMQLICNATRSTSNAYEFLKAQNVGEGIHAWDLFRTIESLGIEYRKDPFLRSVVEAAVLKELRLLKHRARIPVRLGITLFGVMDETGFLKEGEVYLTYDSMAGRFEPAPGNCKVIVTRSPALHPGDIQTAENVVPPEGHALRELCNCVVFSQHGDRDLPSQLSGGDLDGDIYNIIWDPAAVQGIRQVFAPAEYPRVRPLDLHRDVTTEDITKFFIDFMRTDHVGMIAIRHMIFADQDKMGTLAPACLTLARLHSTAVDFSKSGQPVELSELSELPRTNKFRPDFLAPGPVTKIQARSEIDLEPHTAPDENEDSDEDDGPQFKFYKSEKILGRLYREINEEKVWAEEIKSLPPLGSPSFWDDFITAIRPRWEALGEISWHSLTEDAHIIRQSYEDAIHNAMVDFSDNPTRPLTELEVFIGHIINRSGVQSNRQRDKSVKLKEEFDRIATGISRMISNYRVPGVGPEAAQAAPLPSSSLDGLAMSIACLHVGCEEAERPAEQGGRRHRLLGADFQSFKIVAATVLARELRRHENGPKPTRTEGQDAGSNVRGSDAESSASQEDGARLSVLMDLLNSQIAEYGLFDRR